MCHNKSKEPITHRVNEVSLQNSVPMRLRNSCTQAAARLPKSRDMENVILALALVHLGLEVS